MQKESHDNNDNSNNIIYASYPGHRLIESVTFQVGDRQISYSWSCKICDCLHTVSDIKFKYDCTNKRNFKNASESWNRMIGIKEDKE
jgi:hypothetical protein